MKNRNWHILREAGETGQILTLTRRLPARFDVKAETVLPGGNPVRLAHQIRQDMWRLLQSMRGFSPVVRLTETSDGWRVEAGGQVLGRIPPGTEARIFDLLEKSSLRARWANHANRARGEK